MVSTSITIRAVDGEPRVLDTDLAEELGYAVPRQIRRLIKAHLATLLGMGGSRTTAVRGGKGEAYHLNKAQALFIITKAETSRAVEVTVAVIEKFLAYEAGLIPKPTLPRGCGLADTARSVQHACNLHHGNTAPVAALRPLA